MKINQVRAVFFSPTGTTEKLVVRLAGQIAKTLGVPMLKTDFTLPGARLEPLCFQEKELVVFGTPVYAGRVPNVLLKFLNTIEGGGALAIPVSLYGNRNYDNALIELRNILSSRGMHPLAAGAFVGEHSFSTILGAKRPDDQDFKIVDDFAIKAAGIIHSLQEMPRLVAVKGDSEAGYYQPRDRAGKPVDIRKVKPLTNTGCTNCKICVSVCPMGSISQDNVSDYTGICIKCGACIKKCPEQARYYEDGEYLYHKQELEEEFTRRAEPELFYTTL